ncbi:unnamed protein product [Rhizophagus irregularis]|uniref:Uncharacterized protein n=1 Tax=Rhizophagus irregularis TaxID=588596 RepID=A0A915YSA2_9GLOM|nr:unnamed protein product [Rhizophagus irregularis]
MEYGTDNYSCPTTQKQHELSVEDVYDKEELSTKLVVKDHNADMYRVFHSREEFWEFHDNVTEHLRSFSEVVYGDLPQFPRIHVEFGSLNRISGTKIVNLLRQALDGMLEVFRDNYSGITNVPKSPNDFVVMDEYGQNRHGYWTNDFHIQATSFTFTDYKEAKEFTHRVRSSLPVEVGRFISLQYNDPIQLVPILGSTCPKESLHKKVSRFSQFLGTNVDIHKNELFVKKFSDLSCMIPSTPIAKCDIQNGCISSGSSNKHENMNEVPHTVISRNDFTVQQQTTSLAKQDDLCGEESLQNKGYRDKQSDSTGNEQREGTITTLPTKKHLPSINNQYAIALNCLVLLFFIAKEIKQSSIRQMRSGTHVTESKLPQKKKDGMLERQQHQRQHRGNARIGKDLGRRSSNRWNGWKTHSNQNIRFKNYFRKNETNNWERILVSMIPLVSNVICVHNTSGFRLVFTETRSYGCGPHMFIAITPSCQLYQFNPP